MRIRTSTARFRVLIATGAVGTVALLVAVTTGEGAPENPSARAASRAAPTLVAGRDGAPSTTVAAAQATTPDSTPADKPPTGPPTLDGEPMPLKVSVSDTSHLRDGDTVSLHVVPEAGSQVYAFEAFLCAGGATFTDDADIRPLQTGKCVTQPLSAISDKYVQVRAAPPYQSVDGTFRVGVGSNTYTVRDGGPVTIACGPSHPCELVLKLQYPNSYGFAAYPLSYG